MKIRTLYRLEQGIYKVSIKTEDWSENDIRLMEKFGEPDIDIGGELTYSPEDGSVEPATWYIPRSYRRLKSDSFFMSFDSRDTPFAKEFAYAWADKIASAIRIAFSSLRANCDTFTGETVDVLWAKIACPLDEDGEPETEDPETEEPEEQQP